MDSKPNSNFYFVSALGALVLSSAGIYWGSGLHPIWWLTWLAPIPVLIAAPRLPFWGAWGIAFFAWAIGDLNVWHYDRAIVDVPLAICILALLGPAIVFAWAVVLFRRCVLRRALWQAVLIVPALWVAFEYLSEIWSPHSTWGNLGYSQMNFPPILQIASITGIWGISFCVLLFNATIAALASSADRNSKRRLALGAGMFLALVFCFGAWRLHFTPGSPTIKVGLIASDVPANLDPKNGAALPVFEQYAAHIDSLASQGGEAAVIPEKTAVMDAKSLVALDRILSDTAAHDRVFILAGVLRYPGPYNESRLYSPDGRVVATYDKHHLMPQLESDEIPGALRIIVDQPSGKWGLQICKDMDFPQLSRQYGNDGAGLLLVPAWDFVADGWLHGRMAILRGIESGFSIARSVKQGILTVSDDRGRVVAQRNTASAPFVTLIATVPVRHDSTFYDRFGNWFAWLDLFLLATLFVASAGSAGKIGSMISRRGFAALKA
ncbi:MAG TPA: nitrilase-related carbon-nitrogen hydrolase [Bryobacteraceae bacterium]|jgi:apolipoprotein N-acyltransferase|nr:nitrilase-related carbon-nitrogen hydrolase [Bryobacteraceae bacterium]